MLIPLHPPRPNVCLGELGDFSNQTVCATLGFRDGFIGDVAFHGEEKIDPLDFHIQNGVLVFSRRFRRFKTGDAR